MIVPSIDLMQGRAVQLRGGRDFILDGGDPLARLKEFRVAGEVAVVDLDAALGKGRGGHASPQRGGSPRRRRSPSWTASAPTRRWAWRSIPGAWRWAKP